MWRACILLGFLTLSTWAVDRNNFKTCEQSAFCRRNRRMQPGKSPFIASTASVVQVDEKHITVDLINTLNQQSFVLNLEAIEGPSVRMMIDEKNSPVKRYVALPALQPNIVNIPITLKSKGGHQFEATFGEGDANRVVVYGDPFKVEVYSGETLVITANGRGLMKFEHYRKREQKKVDAEPEANQGDRPEEDATKVSYNERGEKIIDGEATKAEDANQAEEAAQAAAQEAGAENDGEDLDGAWEETFKGHTDTKERGPMSVGMDFTFEGFDFIYGLPEHADRFALNPTKGKTDPYRMYNLDVFEYEIYNPMALYGAVPYIIAHSEKHTVAMLYLNPSETWVDIESPNGGMLSSMVGFVSNKKQDIKRETHWFSETGVLDVFFMVGPTPKQVAKQYSQITGVTALPPLFTLGYHQCRWNYNDQEDVRNVDAGFDGGDMPYDVIWLDIEHTDGKRYFTWDPVKFSEPENMIANLTAKGRRMVTIIDPHIKRDSNYFIHSEATAKGYYIKDKSGADYDGWCWPGSSSYLDFFNPEVRDYWADKFALDQYKGSTEQLFTWNDMNEPSVFNGPEVTMQKDCKHVGDLEHRDVHNLYGMMLHMSTYEGQYRRSQGKLRPFVLTRSFFAGSQRYGAAWTGDNMANWDHLRITIPMLLSLSVSGITFVGADVGGFFGNPDDELLIRWYQMASYQPFFRGHAHHDSRRREPWLFEFGTSMLLRQQLQSRYTMLPLWYTLFYENELDGQPPMRPIWWEFPEDTESFGLDDTHLVGNTLLVRPVLERGATSVNIYFPGKDTVWYDIKTRRKFEGAKSVSQQVDINSIPVFQRGGSILFTKQRPRRSSTAQFKDPYTLTVALDKSGTFANGTVYLDDEVSFNYRAGDLIYALAQYDKGILSYQLLKGPGNFVTATWIERIVIVGLHQLPTKITDGEKLMEFAHVEHKIEMLPETDHFGHMVMIRKPAFHMSSQWRIKLHF